MFPDCFSTGCPKLTPYFLSDNYAQAAVRFFYAVYWLKSFRLLLRQSVISQDICVSDIYQVVVTFYAWYLKNNHSFTFSVLPQTPFQMSRQLFCCCCYCFNKMDYTASGSVINLVVHINQKKNQTSNWLAPPKVCSFIHDALLFRHQLMLSCYWLA